MKRILKLLPVLLLFVAVQVQAQQKFGHVNSAEILQLMPDMKSAEKSLETFSMQLDNQYKAKVSDFETKYKGLVEEQQQGTLSPVEEQTRGQEIQKLQAEIQQFELTAQQDIARKRDELISPILDSAQSAIDQVASELGYDYIFDISLGGILVFPDSDDISAAVKTKLGIQ